MAKIERKPLSEASRGRYHIETWGCQINVHDSEKLAGALESEGYSRAAGAEDADVVLLHTCSIREKAAEKVFGELGRLRPLKDRRGRFVLGVTGCVAQQEGAAIFERAPYVDLVVGTRATTSVPAIVARLRGGAVLEREARVDTDLRRDSLEFPPERIRRSGLGAAKAYVTIIEGCNHRCTYCIVPTTRGREICRDLDDVLREVVDLAGRGVVEIEFLGQTVNAYRDERGRTLADLLRSASRVESLRRIRFTTSHPAQMTSEIMDAMAEPGSKVCPYLHLPVQSGSSRVLRAMRRGYDRDLYLRKVADLRSRMPHVELGTDVIVGFPTESERDFEETLSLLDEVGYASCYSFAYSPRPGTAALGLDDPIPLAEKHERLARLQGRQKGIQERIHARWIGSTVEVLVEGASKRDASEWTGRTPEHRVVNFAGVSAPGRLESVRIVGSTAFSLRAEPLGVDA